MFLGELLALAFVGVSSQVAVSSGIVYLLFPERLHMPPVLGISLLPQVLPQASWTFILAIGIGTIVLSAFHLAVRPLLAGARVGDANRCQLEWPGVNRARDSHAATGDRPHAIAQSFGASEECRCGRRYLGDISPRVALCLAPRVAKHRRRHRARTLAPHVGGCAYASLAGA